MIRKAAVAGYFYPDGKDELASFMEAHKWTGKKTEASFVLIPHAGYVYSGATAVKTLSKAALSDTAILLGVNHTGFGEPLAVWDKGAWETPFGDVPVDEALSSGVIRCSAAVSDIVAHVREHSLETAVPILKYFNPKIKIVPITVMGMSMSAVRAFGTDLSRFAGREGCSLIVSSDMNHYENEEITNKKDFLAIEQILAVDGEALYDTVMEKDVSMCGVYPAAAGLIAAAKAGASEGELVEHTTSGAVSGDYDKVVGYAGIIIK